MTVTLAACAAPVTTTTTEPATTTTTRRRLRRRRRRLSCDDDDVDGACATTTTVPRDALVLSGVAVCSEVSGLTTVTWTVSNNTASPIAGTDLHLAFGVSGVTVAAGGSESADQVIVGPAQAAVVEQRVLWVRRGRGRRRCRSMPMGR